MYIAIDTSTEYASFALARDGMIVAEMSWRCGQNHTTQFLPALEFALKQQGLDLGDTEGIVVARGPGSYNGLRVGLSTAKGLCFSLQAPVVGVSTLEAAAYQHAERGLPICAVFNAGRGEIAAGLFQKAGDDWQRLVAEHVTTIETLAATITGPTIFCGEYVPKIAPAIKELLGEKAVIVSPAQDVRRAAYLLELGVKRLQAQDFDDPSTLQPLYLRAPAISEPKHPH